MIQRNICRLLSRRIDTDTYDCIEYWIQSHSLCIYRNNTVLNYRIEIINQRFVILNSDILVSVLPEIFLCQRPRRVDSLDESPTTAFDSDLIQTTALTIVLSPVSLQTRTHACATLRTTIQGNCPYKGLFSQEPEPSP